MMYRAESAEAALVYFGSADTSNFVNTEREAAGDPGQYEHIATRHGLALPGVEYLRSLRKGGRPPRRRQPAPPNPGGRAACLRGPARAARALTRAPPVHGAAPRGSGPADFVDALAVAADIIVRRCNELALDADRLKLKRIVLLSNFLEKASTGATAGLGDARGSAPG